MKKNIWKWIDETIEKDVERTLRLSEKSKLLRVILKLGRVHESLHYLAARILGVKVTKISERKTEIEDAYVWQELIILITPAIPGFILFLGSILFSVIYCDSRIWSIVCLICFCFSSSWLVTCEGDLRDIVELVREIIT